MVEAASRDDAAVFLLSPDRALVATTDFFTPIVDDPATWGAIACANALSDVYAMGGTPLFALNLVGWPRDKLPFEVLGEVLEGSAAVAAEAGCLLVGGHSVDDPEPKYGLVVIGEVHPDRMMTTGGGQSGQALILTKPLGTGILTTARKRDLIADHDLREAIVSMRTLNRAAADVATGNGVRTATDVTGFGLLGHLSNIVNLSGLRAEIDFEAVPIMDGALSLAADGVAPGGTRRNLADLDGISWDGITEAERLICGDAQTSGGLLLAVPPDVAGQVIADLQTAGTLAAAHIGTLVDGPPGTIHVRRGPAGR